MRISKIEKIKGEFDVYDITVDIDHSFIVSDCVLHNSDVCRGYDGKVIKNKDKIKPMPPFHPNCRSSTAPVLDERYAIDESDATRASVGVKGGGQVSADLSYYEWLKQQGAQGAKGRAFVMDVLGKERGDLFLNGGLTVGKFKSLTLDQHFQPIPLKELRKKQSLQLAFDAID